MDNRSYMPPLLRQEEEWDELSGRVIGAAIEVHRELGPGLIESMYEEALCREFELRGIRFQRQVEIPVMYKDRQIGKTRLDLLVEGELIVDLKACEGFAPIHRAQLICYLQVTKKRLGLIINFNVTVLKHGIKRVIRSQ